MKKFRVHILYEHSGDLRPHGCSYIRLLLPLNHPTIADAIIVSQGTTYERADVVIIERTWFPGVSTAVAEDLVKQIRQDGGRIIYSIDDNLLDLHPDGFNRSPFSPEQLMVIRRFAREADAIIVTTDLLKERLARLNENIFVIPNSLDERLWRSESYAERRLAVNGDRKVIGYMGTHTHDADLMMVLQALRATLRKNSGRVELHLVGGVADRAVIEALAGLPVQVLDVGNNVEYPAFARWMVEHIKWDLAIAPLEENVFTRCKSDIKFLDYGALGIPGVFSRGPVYGKTIHHMETGYLADNNTGSWSEALELLLSNDTLRNRMGAKAREHTLQSRTLEHCATNWRDAILSTVDARNVDRMRVGSSI